MVNSVNDLNAEARHVLFQHFQPAWVAIACDDCSTVFPILCDVTRFSARSGACVEDLFSRPDIENLTGNCGAWILNVAMASPDGARRQHVKFNELGISRQRPGVSIKPEELLPAYS